MGKRLKKPRKTTGTKIKASDNDSPLNEIDYPVFCLRHLHKARDYNLGSCDNEHKSAFVSQLETLSQLPWNKINTLPRHGLGWEKLPQAAINDRIPNHVTEDVTLLAFRYHGRKPFVGYRSSFIFHVLFIDHHYELYNH